jgi:formylglycine-generating enzyme required for sulfatase activity
VQRTDRAKRKIVTSSRGGYELVWIPGGKFSMGSPDNEEGRYKSEGPVRLVILPAFFMGRYPVTNEEYGRFLVENPEAREPKYWSERRYNKSSQPVVGVRWIEAKQYARWAGLQLPSEAQWEYACRAGTQTRFCSGELETDLKRVGWYERNSDAPHPVGQKEPNGFGLYDMHGNIWEWVEDDWHKNYSGAPIDGSAWIYKNRRGLKEDIDVLKNNTHLPVVVRGGSVFRSERACRSASRRAEEISYRDNSIGFRLVLPPGQQR